MYPLVDLVLLDLLQGRQDSIRLGECKDSSGSLFLGKKLQRISLYHPLHIWQLQDFRCLFPVPKHRQVAGQEYHLWFVHPL